MTKNFNIHTSHNKEYETAHQLDKHDAYKKRKIASIHKKYQKYYLRILILTLIIATITSIFSRQWLPKLIGLLFLISFSASFAIFVVISAFAVPNFSRPLINTSIPMLCFSAYFLGLQLQWSHNILLEKYRIFRTKILNHLYIRHF